MSKLNVATYILVVCAVVVVGLLVRKEFFLEPQYPIPKPMRFIDKTDTLDLGGIQIGREDAEVTIIEFFDYQCPFCRKFQKSVDYIVKNFNDQVQIRYVHFPLSYHENAFEAAVVAECAHRQNQFLVTHKYLFKNQNSLNSISWKTFAIGINMPDTRKFLGCIKNRETAASVKKGLSAAKQLNISSIPTFLINGRMYKGAIPPELLEILIQSELESK